MSMSYLGIFRHGDAGSELTSPLSAYGKKQTALLKMALKEILEHRQNPGMILACSDFLRALQSRAGVNSNVSCVLMDILTKGHWDPHDEERALDLLERLEKHALAEGATCVIVVGHGNTPAFLARAALRRQGQSIPQVLESAGISKYACGYFVDIILGKVSRVEVDAQTGVWKIEP